MVTKKTETPSPDTSCNCSWSFTSTLLVCILILQLVGMYLLTGNSFSLPEKSGFDVL